MNEGRLMRAGSHGNAEARAGGQGPYKVSAEDIAVGMIAGRNEYYGPAADAVLRYVPNSALFKARGDCPCKFRAAFKELVQRHPHAKWYYVVDEAAMVYINRLLQVLSGYDPLQSTLVAGLSAASFTDKCGGLSRFMTKARCFFGGTGIAMSYTFARALRWDDRPCKSDIEPDFELTCYLNDVWPHGSRLEIPGAASGFGNGALLHNDTVASNKDQSLVVAHHVSSSTLGMMATRNEEAGLQAVRTSGEVLNNAVELNDVAACPIPPSGPDKVVVISPHGLAA